ncbi:MAG: hypothetical protein ACPGSB_07230 [Opitutales bacterium]
MKQLSCLLLALSIVTFHSACATDVEQIPVTESYGGNIDIFAPLVLDDAGNIQTEDFPNEKFEPLLVIRTEQDYSDFLGRIPNKQVGKGPAAAKNNDPMLQKPKIDFTESMLVVLTRAGLFAPEIKKVTRKDGNIVVEAEEYPDFAEARPYGTGSYSAVLIPHSKGKVTVQITEKKMEDLLAEQVNPQKPKQEAALQKESCLKPRTVQGVLKHYPSDVRSAQAWHGYNFMVGNTPVIPTKELTEEKLKEFVGAKVSVTGVWEPGREWKPTEEQTAMPMPAYPDEQKIIVGDGLKATSISLVE